MATVIALFLFALLVTPIVLSFTILSRMSSSKNSNSINKFKELETGQDEIISGTNEVLAQFAEKIAEIEDKLDEISNIEPVAEVGFKNK